MSSKLAALAVVIVSIQIVSLSAASPAAAISVDLAKKCREMAVKAHPPAPPGTTPYAQQERDFFRECVAKNGEMPNNGKGSGQSDPH
jgi:hypothetical protein